MTNKVDESEAEFNEENEKDSGTLAFAPAHHKALLKLLQGASNSQSHSISHLTTQPDIGTSILCIIPNSYRLETFILDSGATDHVCYTRKKLQCMKRIKPNNHQNTKWSFSNYRFCRNHKL